MPYEIFDGLEPKEFFRWFGAVTEIPRPSGHEEKLAAFLTRFAEERGLPCETDAGGNVFMTVPASEGYENEPKILFQAHMDIVPAKDPGVEFDFLTDSIRLWRDGDYIRGCGTNLGTDNGVGLATMLALADTKTVPHPALELLFTTREEVGLQGVREFDMRKITARRMVNMDSGGSQTVAVCSCGKVAGVIESRLPTAAVPAGRSALKIHLFGGLGGHPGLQIGKERACACNLLGELLCELDGLRWQFVRGEAPGNPILREVIAEIVFPAESASAVRASLETTFELLRGIYEKTDPDLQMELSDTSLPASAVTEEASVRLAALLTVLRTNKARTDLLVPSRVITSGAITAFRLQDGALLVKWQSRSFLDADQMLLFRQTARAAAAFGFDLKVVDSYSGWKGNPESPFRDKLRRVYSRLFGVEMNEEYVQGGIEVGPIVGAIPDMDAIGFMPSCGGAHTTSEKLQLKKLPFYWDAMMALVSEKDEP